MVSPGTGGTLHCGRAERGFSLIELVTVIVVVGVLAAVTVTRFVGTDSFASRGFYDQGIETVRFAQKLAIAWRGQVFVCVTANGIAAAAAPGCATPLTHPTTGAALAASAPSGVTLSPVGDFTFNGLGKPSAGTTITLTSMIAGDPARQIVVEAETGYVHP